MTAPESPVVIPLDLEPATPGDVAKNKFGTTLIAPEVLVEDDEVRTEHIRRPQNPDDPQDIRFIPAEDEETEGDQDGDGIPDSEDPDYVPGDDEADTESDDDLAKFRDA